jgi:hypothetical protein
MHSLHIHTHISQVHDKQFHMTWTKMNERNLEKNKNDGREGVRCGRAKCIYTGLRGDRR